MRKIKSHLKWAICAFIGIGSLFQIQASYWDSRHLNWIPVVVGIVFCLLGAYFLYKTATESGSGRTR